MLTAARRRQAFLFISLLLLAGSFPRVGQAQSAGPDAPLDAKTRRVVLTSLLAQLQASYVFPEVATRVAQALRQQAAAGAYSQLTSSQQFAQVLTAQLRQLSQDQHLGLRYLAPPATASQAPAPAPAAEARQQQQLAEHRNFDFVKVERLAGNVGYLRLDGFMPADLAAPTAAAAMRYLAYTDALIVDLRDNRGGDPGMVTRLASYFFGADSVHLNDLYWREGGRTQHFWTQPARVATHYAGPVYLLTSARTFSAGEEFAYDLQSRRRATVVGEATGGGANPGGPVPVGGQFVAFIPTGRALNPVTHTNWEGVGVRPDVAQPAAQALKTAHLAALARLQAAAGDELAKKELTVLIEQVGQQP